MTVGRWLELFGTVIWPTAVLTFGGRWADPPTVLVVGLLPPLVIAIGGAIREGRPSPLSVLATASILVTGGIGLLQLDTGWFAVKEMLVPVVMGTLIAGTASTRYAALGVVLDQLLDRARLQAVLADRGPAAFERAVRGGTVRLGLVTAGSGPISALLARSMIRSPSGTEAFTAELGSYTGWSFALVTVPLVVVTVWILRRALDDVERALGTRIEDLLISAPPA